MTKALVIVDMLNDFVDEKGALPVKGARDLVGNIVSLKKAAENYNLAVVYANDAHTEDDPEFKVWPKHCVKDTFGAKVIDELVADGKAFEKQDLSMFTNKEADKVLRQYGISELYITGVATEYCVRAAALDARKLGYKVNVVVDAIAGVDLQKGDQYKALLEMGNAGVRPVTTKQALEELVR